MLLVTVADVASLRHLATIVNVNGRAADWTLKVTPGNTSQTKILLLRNELNDLVVESNSVSSILDTGPREPSTSNDDGHT